MSNFSDLVGKDVRKGNPFRSIYVPSSSKELLDICFRRALKVSYPGGLRLNTIKKKKSVVITRIKVLSREISQILTDLVKKFPSTEKMHEFYLSTMELWLPKENYKKTIAKIYGAAQLVKRIAEDYIIKVRALRKPETMTLQEFIKKIDRLRREAYGRISSVVNSLDKDLRKLADLVKNMKKLPDYDPELPTIVVAGPPNSGKSSFVKAVSNAKVEIASYPFTTKNVTFGIIEYKQESIVPFRIQIADTPGLFDRPLSERKDAEIIALKAIQHIADIVLFLYDGSVEAVMNAKEQINVYKTVKTFFGEDKPILPAINKVDIIDKDLVGIITSYMERENIKPMLISIRQKLNLDKVLERIIGILKEKTVSPSI